MTTVILAALAAVGLAAVLWLLLGACLVPTGTEDTLRVCLLASGAGAEVEHTLRGLKWLRTAGLLRAGVDIVDTGLNGEGRAQVKHLLRQYPGTRFIQTERE
ncbi:MAG: hypothetical protein LUG44_01620 [Clostridiales bacterium]|nr:hypothetical protein [Clostridiales bacterium]MCD7886309.1 hypothetical protein [Clostridiales bacterium]